MDNGQARAITDKTKRDRWRWKIIDDDGLCIGYSTKGHKTENEAHNSAIKAYLIMSRGIDGEMPWYVRLAMWAWHR